MSEPATLDPIVYEPVLNEKGEQVGLRVPDSERERVENGTGYPSSSAHLLPPEPLSPEARTLDALVADLQSWLVGDERLYGQLAALYAREPQIADRLTAAAVNGAMTGSLRDPSAYLASRLRPRK